MNWKQWVPDEPGKGVVDASLPFHESGLRLYVKPSSDNFADNDDRLAFWTMTSCH